MTVKYYTRTPAQISPDTMQQIADLIAMGGEVDGSQISSNLARAGAISYAAQDGKIVAVVVLKRPNTSYRDRVFVAAQANIDPQDYPLEVGYVYAQPQVRNTRVIYDAFHQFNSQSYGKVFATVRQNNTKAIRLLQRSGYRQQGHPYASSRGDYNLLLWTNS